MRTTIKLYRLHSGFANISNAFSLDCRDCDEYHGDDSHGEEYLLPEGYSIGRMQCGELAIYDASNDACEIIEHECGRPQLISRNRKMPVLKRGEAK